MSLVMMFVAEVSMSQNKEMGTTSVGILGGINFQNFNGKDFNGDQLDNDLLAGFHIGFNVQIPIAPEFYIQPGLLFSTKGAKNSDGSIERTYRLSYLELPLNFVYKSQVGNGHIMLGFGPYVAYAISGKATFVTGSGEVVNDIEFTNEPEGIDPLLAFKPLDVGGNILFGYEMASGIFIQLNAQLGLVEINPDDQNAPNVYTVKNTGFGLSLGYRF
jgi:hypothetical protein